MAVACEAIQGRDREPKTLSSYNPFNRDQSPVPYTKRQQAEEYRIYTLACGLEAAEDSIDIVAYMIETNDLVIFDPRTNWLLMPDGLNSWLKTLTPEDERELADKIRGGWKGFVGPLRT